MVKAFLTVKTGFERLWAVSLVAVLMGSVVAFSAGAAERVVESEIAQLIEPQVPVDEHNQRALDQILPTRTISPVELREIVVVGNRRISDGRVKSFFDFAPGDLVDSAMINKSVGRLYRSGLFETFSAEMSPEGVLRVEVVENPIINRISFEGNKAIKDEILETAVASRARLAFNPSRIDEDVRKIQEIYRQSGRFAVQVRPVSIQRSQNRVDVVFEITEGDKTRVESIDFIGNAFATDGELRDEMLTKTSSLFSGVFGGDSYDPDKLAFDAENIRNFYLRHGFLDFQILSATSELNPDREGFRITIAMREGAAYDVDEITIKTEVPEIAVETMSKAVVLEKGERFNNVLVRESLLALEQLAQQQGFAFVKAVPQIRKSPETRTVGVNFVLTQGPRKYVEQINVVGNVRTLDYVIRREFVIAEGDPLSVEKIAESRKKLVNTGYFKSVEITRRQGSSADRTILDVTVEEQSTGAISAGAGLSTTSGVFARIGISENNFLGKGFSIGGSVSFGRTKRDFSLSFSDPYFLDRELSLSYALFRETDKTSDSRKFDYARTGGSVSIGSEIFKNLNHRSSLTVSSNKISNVTADASTVIKDQEGLVRKYILGQSLSYDLRDSAFRPRKGSVISAHVDLAVLGGYRLVRGSIAGRYYAPVSEHSVISIGGSVGHVRPLGDTNLQLVDNFFAGGESDLRGFEGLGVGPRLKNSGDPLGGRTKFLGSVSLRMPSGLPRHYGVDLILFSDVGIVRNHGFKIPAGETVQESGSLRASVGIGVEFGSSVPISLYLARPIRKEDWDQTEHFFLSLGTNF